MENIRGRFVGKLILAQATLRFTLCDYCLLLDWQVATEYQLRFGMGITVSVSDRPGMANALAMMAEPIPIGEPPSKILQNSFD